MCTAISWSGNHHYFGRNLDLEYAYEECVVITPRNYPFHFRCAEAIRQHYAMIGTATVAQEYPLYYEATNEKGLSMAGLNFPGNAAYYPHSSTQKNIAPFELIPWILGQCADVNAAVQMLSSVNLASIPFSDAFPLSPLHWIISDRNRSIVAEPMEDGLYLYDNPFGVLTNNPPFPYHQCNLINFLSLSPRQATNHFSNELELQPYSNGMGAIGLPGDYSSASRFVKATFVKQNSVSCINTESEVVQFFHLLRSVEMPRGSVVMADGRNEITLYSSCCDTNTGIYYYSTYENSTIHAVNMHGADLSGKQLIVYPMIKSPTIIHQN